MLEYSNMAYYAKCLIINDILAIFTPDEIKTFWSY